MALEELIDSLCDTSDLTGAEVREELAEQGIDLDAAKARFLPKLDDMMRARAVRLALAAVRDNPLNPDSPLPWRGFGRLVLDRSGNVVCRYIYADRDCTPGIAACVNAAPHLLARVAELEAEKATMQARFDDLRNAAWEVAEVAQLRGEGQLNPCDDPVPWTSRWNDALANIAEEVEK